MWGLMEHEQDCSDRLPIVAPPLGHDTAVKLREGIRQAQTRFAWAVIVCSAGVTLCCPRWGDKPRAQALQDLEALGEQLDVRALSRTLVERAEHQTATDLQPFVRTLGMPRLRAASGAHSQAYLFVADAPDLSSLEAMALATRPGAPITLTGPNLDALASSLRWRLERSHRAPPFTLTQLRRSRSVSPQAVELEARAAEARIDAANALAGYERAREQYNEKRDLSDLLVQRGAATKTKFKAARERSLAYEEVERRSPAMRTTRDDYERLAKAAMTADLRAFTGTSAGIGVLATLRTGEGEALEYEIPLAINRQITAISVPAPRALTRLQNSAQWHELRALSAPRAAAQLRRELSWHSLDTQVAGLRIRGVTALQIFPLILCFVMLQLTRTCRAVSRAFSPVGFTGTDLTNPGTGRLWVDGALLVAPPALALILTCYALIRLGAVPWIAAPLGILAFVQSGMAVLAWKHLHGLCAGARHTSLVPPLPEHPQRRMVTPTVIQG